LLPYIVDRVAAGRPVLGICVGMQILFEYGDEHGVVTKGLGLLPGGVVRLVAPVVPHMGWNTVCRGLMFAGWLAVPGSTSCTPMRRYVPASGS
jgi:glutamine amidotransferase